MNCATRKREEYSDKRLKLAQLLNFSHLRHGDAELFERNLQVDLVNRALLPRARRFRVEEVLQHPWRAEGEHVHVFGDLGSVALSFQKKRHRIYK